MEPIRFKPSWRQSAFKLTKESDLPRMFIPGVSGIGALLFSDPRAFLELVCGDQWFSLSLNGQEGS